MTNLFTYGSLMCDDIMLQASGEFPKHQKAQLFGYFRSKIHGEQYPGIRPKEGHIVDGILYFDISEKALNYLDSFEGEYYERREITVLCSGQEQIQSASYIIKPQYDHLLTGEDWNYEDFLQEGKSKFEESYFGFDEV